MARAKTEAFDPVLVRTAAVAKALAHPVRIRILEILADRRACICGCLVELLPLAQSTVSQHLRELRDTGLIRGEIDGPRTCYCLDAMALAEAQAALMGVFRRISRAGRERPEKPALSLVPAPPSARGTTPNSMKRSRHEKR